MDGWMKSKLFPWKPLLAPQSGVKSEYKDVQQGETKRRQMKSSEDPGWFLSAFLSVSDLSISMYLNILLVLNPVS